jgi:transcription termination/antitermination protein NusG
MNNLKSDYMADNKKWLAVYTKPRWEQKVTELLTKEQIVTYCPLNHVVRQWSDRRKWIYEPLFPSYVFVNVDTAEISRIKSITGIINFVCWLGKPAIIRDEEIEIIKRFLHEYDNVNLEIAEVNVNDVVRITNGPLMQAEGSILSIGRKRVKVYLPTLGYAMVADIEKSNVKIIKRSATPPLKDQVTTRSRQF